MLKRILIAVVAVIFLFNTAMSTILALAMYEQHQSDKQLEEDYREFEEETNLWDEYMRCTEEGRPVEECETILGDTAE